FTIGGTNGVKIYEESSVYSSNGFFANIEAKYKLPELNGINNSIGAFYDYGQIWESESIIPSTENISVQDTGVGIYTNYKKFFSIVQMALELGDSEISTKDDENYRVILQAGFVF
ncbi:MAG: ShlB/FhaC/HecB family hemolysin secretion/activation protein, partial [Sulfurovum sp.]|nr:ShlB/FhaC/HecB family hemolysin secretion/activation protein [Sulfurovum sp.]